MDRKGATPGNTGGFNYNCLTENKDREALHYFFGSSVFVDNRLRRYASFNVIKHGLVWGEACHI